MHSVVRSQASGALRRIVVFVAAASCLLTTLVCLQLVQAPRASASTPIGTYSQSAAPGPYTVTAYPLQTAQPSGQPTMDYEPFDTTGFPFGTGNVKLELIDNSSAVCATVTSGVGAECPYGSVTSLEVWDRPSSSQPWVQEHSWALTTETFNVSLSADATEVTVAHVAVLTASTTSNLDGWASSSPWAFYDETEGEYLSTSCEVGSSCRISVGLDTGPPHVIVARLLGSTGTSTLVLAQSNAVSIDHAPWSVDLFYDSSAGQVTAVPNQYYTSSGSGLYWLEIDNAQTGAQVAGCSSSPCSYSVSGRAPTHYVAQITKAGYLLATSNEVLAPTTGPTGSNGNCQCSTGDPINTSNGMLTELARDFDDGGRGLSLSVGRNFSTERDGAAGPFGLGWQPSFGTSLRLVANQGYGIPMAKPDGSAPNTSTAVGISAAPPDGVWPGQHPTTAPLSELSVHTLSSDPSSIPGNDQNRAGNGELLSSAVPAIQVVQEDGSVITFNGDGHGNYTPPSYVPEALAENSDGSWTLTRSSGLSMTFNPLGWLTSESDPNGDTLTMGYDSQAKLSSITDSAGRSLSFSYGANGAVSEVTDPAGRTVQYGYDTSGHLTSVINPAGRETDYGYDSSNRLTTVTDPRGNTTTNSYDSENRVTQQVDRAGRTTGFAYTSSATTITEPNGSTTVENYSNGELSSSTQASGTSHAQTTSYTYDLTTLKPASITDANGHTWTATYNADGDILSDTDPLSHTESWTYNSLDRPTSFTDRDGVTTTNTYDSNGNILTTSTPIDGTHTSTTTLHHADPSHPGDITSITNPDGKTSSVTYGSYGQVTSVTDPDGNKTSYSYGCTTGCNNSIGWLYSTVSPRGNITGNNPADYTTSNTYNNAGDLLSVTDPRSHVTSYTYDANGNITTSTDPRGKITSYTYNHDDQPTGTVRPDSTTLSTSYDSGGSVATQTNGAGKVTSYAHNQLEQVTSMTTPATATSSGGIVTGYSYDTAGNLATVTAPGPGSSTLTTSFGHDNANRLTSVTHSDGTTPNVSYGYDHNGNRTSMTDGTGTTSYSYDDLGQLTGTTDGNGDTSSYGRDLAGNVTTIGYPNGHDVTRSYDDAGQLTQVEDWNSNATQFQYNADGALTHITYPNGVDEAYTYDKADTLNELTDSTSSSTLADYAYTRNNDDQLTAGARSGTGAGPSESYDHNDLGQLTSYTVGTTSGSYGYDAADNLTSLPDGTAQTFDNANELLTSTAPSASATTYGYDKRGNRTSITPAVGATTNYSYDQANDLTGYSKGTTTAGYTYDGDGNRASKTVGSTTTHFAWDAASGDLPLLLSDGSSNYIYGPDDLPIEQTNASGTTLNYLQHDQQGSSRLLTDATGSIVGSYDYSPYGVTTSHTGASTTLRYDGQYQDDETGLYYLRARYYDPSTAQFLTRDPLEDITGQPYAYANDDPIDNSDPSGLHWYDDASNWVAGFGDTLTLGGTAQIRRLINYDVNGDMNDVVDTCSTFYTWGGYGGLDAGAGLGAEDAADLLGSGWKWVRSDDGGWIRIKGLPDEPPEGTPGTVQRTGPSQTGPARDALGNPFGTARTWPLKIGAIITRLGQILAGTHHG